MSNVQNIIDKYEKSLNELSGFYDQSKDEYNKQFLDSEIRKLRIKINDLKSSIENSTKQTINYKIIQNYSFEDDNDTVKIYLNRSDLNENISKEQCKVDLLDNGLGVVIYAGNGKLLIKNLTNTVRVDDEKPFVKITKSFVIFILKKIENKKWTSLQKTTTAAAAKGLDDFKPDKDADPSQSMMQLMKKLYTEGDDETKKMINKAWATASNRTSNPSLMEDGF